MLSAHAISLLSGFELDFKQEGFVAILSEYTSFSTTFAKCRFSFKEFTVYSDTQAL